MDSAPISATTRSDDDQSFGQAEACECEDHLLAKTTLPRLTLQSLPMELLSVILGNLECLDLFRCQSVCKRWKNAILGERKLREAMFLEHREEPVEAVLPLAIRFTLETYEDDGSKDWIPQYVCYLDEKFTHLPAVRYNQAGSARRTICYHPIVTHLDRFLNLINPNFIPIEGFGKSGQALRSAILFVDDTDWKQQARQCTTMQSERWKHMFLSAPPMESCTFDISSKDMYWPRTAPPTRKQCKIVNPLGVTVGQFVETIQQYIDFISRSHIGVE